MRFHLSIFLLCLAFCLVPFRAAAGTDIEAAVSVDEGTVIVDASFSVDASPQEVWAVMTDFEHMTEFISNLQSSKVISRATDKVQVAQKGGPSRGFFSYSFDVVKEFELTPFEKIRSHLLSGSMKKFDGVTSLSADGAGTLIVSHAESIPNVWVPPIIGPAFIKSELKEQVQEMRREILRRKQAAAAAPAAERQGEVAPQ